MVLRALLSLWILVGSAVARADEATTREALARLEEVLLLRLEDGSLDQRSLTPALIVSVQPARADSQPWFATAAVEALGAALGTGGLRLCEACMAPRSFVRGGGLEVQSGPLTLQDIAWLDESTRGTGAPARSAIWIDETPTGVALRIVDLSSGQILFAQNMAPDLTEGTRSARLYTLSEELERRARGDSVTQAFVDFALYPGQHIALDWTEQWGPENRNLTGVVVSLVDPVLGIGAAHYRAVPIGRVPVLFGGKAILSIPTGLARALAEGTGDLIDPPLTIVGVSRVPFGRSNYGALITVSTNGAVGIGISLMNISLLPVLL